MQISGQEQYIELTGSLRSLSSPSMDSPAPISFKARMATAGGEHSFLPASFPVTYHERRELSKILAVCLLSTRGPDTSLS